MRERTVVVVLCLLVTQLIGCQKSTDHAATPQPKIGSTDATAAVALSAIPTADSRLVVAYNFLQAGSPDEAEAELRRVISDFPDDARGCRTLAQLLNAQGRRSETPELLLSVERLEGMSQLESFSLIDVGSAFRLVDFGNLVNVESPSRYTLGNVRFFYGKGERHRETLDLLAPLMGTKYETLAVKAFTGRVIAESGDEAALDAWIDKLPPGIDAYPEYWLAVGIWVERQQRWEEAIRAYGEAILRDPTERRALRSLANVIDQVGGQITSTKTRDTVTTLDRMVFLASTGKPEDLRWIGEQLTRLVRPLEGIAWLRHSLLQGCRLARAQVVV